MMKLIMILHSKYSWDKLLVPIAVIESLLVLLCISSEHKKFFIPFTVITFIPLILDWKAMLVFAVSTTIILAVYFSFLPGHNSSDHLSGVFKVKRVIGMGIVVSNEGNNILLKTKSSFNQYDEIKIDGIIGSVKNTSDFDLVTYLKSMNIRYIVNQPKIDLLARTNDIRVTARQYVTEGGEWYKMVTPLIFLGEKTDETKEIYNLSLQMNVVHLFVISGFHISLLHKCIFKLLVLIKCNIDIALWLPLIPIWIYLFFLGFPISATRAVLLTTFLVINKSLLSQKFDSIQIVSLVMALMAMWDPMSIYSLSFIFTFMATFVIVFIQGIEFESKTVKYLSIVLFTYLSNVVIAIHINHYFSILGIIFGVVLCPVFIIVYMLNILMFPFKDALNYIDHGFVWIMRAFSQINVMINVSKFDINYLYGIYGFIWLFPLSAVAWNKRFTIKSFIYRIKHED